MNIVIPKAFWRIIVVIFFEVAFCLILLHAYFLITSPYPPNTWLIGDWLINYQGGIVRRGLFGEILFNASQLSSINIVVLVIVVQVVLYLVFFINTCRLAINSPFSALSAMIIFSPAFILFPVLDSLGAFRKEILLFALLSTLCSYLITANRRLSKNLPIYIGLLSIFIVLSHEMLVVYFPYIICAFIIHDNGLSSRVKKVTASLAPSIAIAFFLLIFSRGDKQVVTDICNSLTVNAPLDCNYPDIIPGAISFLGKNVALAHDFVLESIDTGTILVYIFTAFLGLLPLVLIFFSKQFAVFQKSKETRFWLAIGLALAIVGSFPLFWAVADFGRIIYIHITCLSLLALMVVQEKHNEPLHLNYKQILAWLSVILFVSSWRLIHWQATVDGAFPLKSLFESFF